MAQERSIWKGVVAGAVSGLAATWIMTQYQTGSQKLMQRIKQSRQGEQAGEGKDQQQAPPSENPTVAVAQKIAHSAGIELPEDKKAMAGNLVHYGFGTSMGMVYGALSEVLPATTAGRGLAYAAGLWAAADELVLPAAGLAKWWPEYPVEVHANALAAHVVYAKAMDEIRRGVRRLLDVATGAGAGLESTEFRTARVHRRAGRPAEVRTHWFGKHLRQGGRRGGKRAA